MRAVPHSTHVMRSAQLAAFVKHAALLGAPVMLSALPSEPGIRAVLLPAYEMYAELVFRVNIRISLHVFVHHHPSDDAQSRLLLLTSQS